MNERIQKPNGWTLTRRELLGTAGGATLAVMLPLTAASVAAPRTSGIARVGGARLSDWHPDDVWGAYPRYAEPIPFAKTKGVAAPAVEPLEAL